MSTRVGRVIACDGASTIVEFDSDCGSCKGCNQQQSRSVHIPGAYSDEVVLSVDMKSQAFALFYSLVFPVLLAVLAAFVSDWLLLGELSGIFITLCCFTIGMVLCRPLGLSALGVVEKSTKD